jgi:hypothetical protein
MSNTDSFIDEVTDEVRRDKLYATLRRYGWIGALVVVLIVGGAAWSEYRKAEARAKSEALGDQLLAALDGGDAEARSDNLAQIYADEPGAKAVVRFLTASEAQAAGDVGAAVAQLDTIAIDGEVPEIYRQIAAFKSLTLQAGTLDAQTRRERFEALAAPGAPLHLLSVEQLALIDIEEGNTDAAIERYQSILVDAGVTSDLQQRALQVIVTLGGTPDVENLPTTGN